MYYPYFVVYILAGLGISLLVFFWALKNGQFRDQQRARFLPLEEEPKGAGTRPSRLSRYEIYGLAVLAVSGLAASTAVLVFALFVRP